MNSSVLSLGVSVIHGHAAGTSYSGVPLLVASAIFFTFRAASVGSTVQKTTSAFIASGKQSCTGGMNSRPTWRSFLQIVSFLCSRLHRPYTDSCPQRFDWMVTRALSGRG